MPAVPEFDESDHPRSPAGRFAPKEHAEASVDFAVPTLFVPGLYRDRYGWSTETLLDGTIDPHLGHINRVLLTDQVDLAMQDTSYVRRTETLSAAQTFLDQIGYGRYTATDPSPNPRFTSMFTWVVGSARYRDHAAVGGHETDIVRDRFMRDIEAQAPEMSWEDLDYIRDNTDFGPKAAETFKAQYATGTFGATDLHLARVPEAEVHDWNRRINERAEQRLPHTGQA